MTPPGFWQRRGLGPGRRGAPYGLTAAVLLGTLAVSQAISWAERAFGGNVPPLFARLSPSLGPLMVVPILLAGVAWLAAPRLSAAPAPVFLAVTVLFGWGFAVALAAQAGGTAAVTAPFRSPLDYYANVPLVDALGPRTFAERYPDLQGQLSLHASTHPPGAPLLLWSLSEAFGGSLLAVSVTVAFVGAAGVFPTYWLARYAYGERPARFSALLFAASPGVLLFSATSMDAVFMTTIALALAAAVRAPASDAWSAATGALTAVALAFTFGAAAVGLVALGAGILAWRTVGVPALVRRGAVAAVALIAIAAVIRVAAGIDLVAAFRSALDAHLSDPSRDRPYAYWVVANLAAFLLSAGIPQAALLVDETRRRWRDRRPGLETILWGTLVVASASGLFKGEVDHIWLFLVPLVAAAAGSALAGRGQPPTRSDHAARFDHAARLPILAALAQAILMEVLLFTFW